ncbi:MAG: hypothetical protein Q8R17_00145 [bacterium]|nr:hypothetical protein [bacterium]
MKTIIITSFHPFVSRNILSAPFFGMLKKAPGARIVIVCPEKKKDFLQKEYGAVNVFVEGVPGRIRRLDAFFKDLATAAVRTRSLTIMQKMRIGFERPWLIRALRPFALFLRPLIPFLYRLIMPKNAYAELFEKWKPLLVFSTDVFGSADSRITNEAKCRGIATIGMVRSWDNLTTKGGFRVIPDTLVVNNEIVKREAVEIHNISPKIIRVVGVPHYDRYKCPNLNALKAEWLVRGKRIILYSPLGDRIIKVGDGEVGRGFDDGMIRLLARVIPDSHILFVRMPPTDTVFLDEKTMPNNVVIERPGTRFGDGGKAIKVTELSAADDIRLVETICGSDIVLTVFSSIAVDALVLGKTVILLGCDPKPTPFWKSVARLHELDHIQPLVAEGIPAVYDIPALRSALFRLLENPDADQKAQEQVANEQAYGNDGRASERLLEVVLSAIKS